MEQKDRHGMIAILDKGGAFLYGCSKEQADERITKECKRGGLDYDENGNMRKDDGMIGWLFCWEGLIQNLIFLRCDAIYLMDYTKDRYNAISGIDEFYCLDYVWRKIMYGEKTREG